MNKLFTCFKLKNINFSKTSWQHIECNILMLVVLVILPIYQATLVAQPVETLTIVRGDGFWPPYEWTEHTELKGFHIDLIEAVATTLQIKIQIESYPWKRAIKMVKDGNADAITFITRTKEREKFLYYMKGNQLHLSKAGLIMLKGNKHNINFTGDLSQLRKFTICAQFGHYYGEKFEQATYLDVDDGAKSSEQLIKKLINGRCELAVGYRYVKEVAEKKGLGSDLVNLTPHLSVHPMYIAFSKPRHREKIAFLFSEAMTFFKSTPAYRALIKKYNLAKSRQVN
jgi:polar amino acid transport system substrate-binding protein